MTTRILKRVMFLFVLPVVLLTAWWFLSAGGTDYRFPSLEKILTAFVKSWLQPEILAHAAGSVMRLLSGYFSAIVIGIAAGTVIGVFPRVRMAATPVVEFIRAIPPPVLIPLLLLVFGLGSSTKALVIGIGCLWPILLNTIQGVRSIDPVVAETARSYRISGLRRVRSVILPAAMPQIMAGLRQSLSLGVILMVTSEMMAVSGGLGYLVLRFERNFDIPEMWAGILVLGVLGFSLSLVFRLVENQILKWYFGMQKLDRGQS